MLHKYRLILAAGCVWLTGCATPSDGGAEPDRRAAGCNTRPTAQLATLPQARACIDAYRDRYGRAATANGDQRRGFRAATLVGSLGAVANALADGSEGATTALGLVAGTSTTLSPIVAPPARVPIYLDGQRAANCLFRASSQSLDRATALAGEPFTRFETQVAALQERLATAPAHADASRLLVERFEEIRSSINDLVALRDAVRRARSATRLAGDHLMSSLVDVDLAVQLRLHRVDVSLESSIQAANQSVLTLAGQMSQRPDLFTLPDPDYEERGSASNPLDGPLARWNAATRTALEPVTELAGTVTALLDSMQIDTAASDTSRCVDMAAGLTSDVIVLRRPPVNIDLGDSTTHRLTLDVDGGNAPYTAQWIGSAPDGLTLSIGDSGAGEFLVVANPGEAKTGRYQLLLRDEDLRPLLVTLRVVGTAPAATPETPERAPETPEATAETPAATALVENGEAHAVCQVKAGLTAPYQGVAALQAGICHHLTTVSDFDKEAGFVFMIDDTPGSATDDAARELLEDLTVPLEEDASRDRLYGIVCRELDLDSCAPAIPAPD